MLRDLARGHATCVQPDDLVVKSGEAPPVFTDQHWVEAPMPITRNVKLQFPGIGDYGLAAVTVAVIASVLLRPAAQMVVHLGVEHSLGQPLLQFIDQTTALEH